jgi:FAD/FMN-containing dehydrogenase
MIDQRGTTTSTLIDDRMIHTLRAHLRGTVLCPGDSAYEAARKVWNAMIEKRPVLIVRCAGVADVMAAVRLAREHQLLVAVRGGGHNFAGYATCDGGIVIDLSLMQGIHVDPQRLTARAQGGVTWGAFDHETQAFGLATTGGTDPTTGIAGPHSGGWNGLATRQIRPHL